MDPRAMESIIEAEKHVFCAKAAHEVNNVFCEFTGDPKSPAWDDLRPAEQNGIVANVAHVLGGGTFKESHERWMKSRLDDGWTYGPVKSFADKTSPNLVPYEDLPPRQKYKDQLYAEVVAAMYKALQCEP